MSRTIANTVLMHTVHHMHSYNMPIFDSVGRYAYALPTPQIFIFFFLLFSPARLPPHLSTLCSMQRHCISAGIILLMATGTLARPAYLGCNEGTWKVGNQSKSHKIAVAHGCWEKKLFFCYRNIASPFLLYIFASYGYEWSAKPATVTIKKWMHCN